MKPDSRSLSKRKSTAVILCAVLIFAVLMEIQISWMLVRNGAQRSTTLLLNQIETVLNDNASDLEERTEELKQTYISYAQTIAYILDAQPQVIYDIDELKSIADFQHIDEIHIFDTTGTIIAGTVPEYYGYSFDSGEQMAFFKPMLEDKSLSLCQDVTPNTAEGKSMMYALAWNRAGTMMIQVGIEPKRLLEELASNEISSVVNHIPLTEGFGIYVVDPASGKVAASTDSERVDFDASSYADTIGSGTEHAGSGVIRHNGAYYYCNYRLIGGYIVAVAYDMGNSSASIIVPTVIIAVYMLIAGIMIFLLFSRIYKSEAEKEKQTLKLEESIRELQEEEDIIRAAGHGVWRCPIGSDGHVRGMIGNEEWKKIFAVAGTDMSPEECLAYFADHLADPEGDLRQFDFSDLKPGIVLRMTFGWKHPAKGLIYVEVAGTRHVLPDGDIQISGYAADVTEQTLAKQKWEKELTEARERAEAADKAKTTFLFNMSHDIRTPMNAIIGYTDLIEKHMDDRERCLDYYQKIRSSSDFLLSLINNVLEMARIESGKSTLDEAVFKAGTISDEIASVYAQLMRRKNITFTHTTETQTEYIYGDTVKLKEIWLNIVSNAYKYTPEGGSVTIRTVELPCSRPGYAMMRTTFADTGIGMSADYLKVIFEEFSRERNSTEARIQGTGLGMAIVKKLVDLMGGTITVESELGKGSTFVITLTHRIGEAPKENTENPANASALSFEKFRGKRILLAEDNDLNAEIAEEILTEAGFAVERAADGVICVDMLQKASCGYYDVILMDVQMPNMDGYKATQAIRAMKDPCRNRIPVIAMTANAFESDKQNAFAAGMNGHIAKPINVNELMKALAENIH